MTTSQPAPLAPHFAAAGTASRRLRTTTISRSPRYSTKLRRCRRCCRGLRRMARPGRYLLGIRQVVRRRPPSSRLAQSVSQVGASCTCAGECGCRAARGSRTCRWSPNRTLLRDHNPAGRIDRMRLLLLRLLRRALRRLTHWFPKTIRGEIRPRLCDHRSPVDHPAKGVAVAVGRMKGRLNYRWSTSGDSRKRSMKPGQPPPAPSCAAEDGNFSCANSSRVLPSTSSRAIVTLVSDHATPSGPSRVSVITRRCGGEISTYSPVSTRGLPARARTDAVAPTYPYVELDNAPAT